MKTNLENYEERFVDYMEGQLSAEEMREVEAFVAQHPELEEDFKLFCSTKLEPDTNMVYTKKESLMRPSTVIRPLFVKIAAAAACVALLIGIGIRFLGNHQTLEQQPLMAELSPRKAQSIVIPQMKQELRESNAKPVALPKPKARTEVGDYDKPTNPTPVADHLETSDFLATITPIEPKSLEWNTPIAYDDVEIRMFDELGERLLAVTMEPSEMENPLSTELRDFFWDNISQTTRSLYKRTAKTFMDIYYTADYRITEAKEDLMASR